MKTTDSLRRYINSVVSDTRLFSDEEREQYYKQAARVDHLPELQRIADEVYALEQGRWTKFKEEQKLLFA